MVVDNPQIKPLIDKAVEALNRGDRSDTLENSIERIREIKQGINDQEESYEDFRLNFESIFDFNKKAQELTNSKQMLQLENQKAKTP